MILKPWEVLSSRLLLDASPWVRVFGEHVRLPNGYEIGDYYRVTMPDWAQVFAVTADGWVTMIEHYKHGASVVSLELPAGYLEPGEPPEEAARRELLEETGMEADIWRSMGSYFVDGNRGCGWTHAFLALEARQIAQPHLEESEIIVSRRMTLDEVRAAWRGGRIHNVATIAAVGLALALLEENNHAADTRTPGPNG